MLSDEHRREIQYALEYAMLAILNRLPLPVPPPLTWSEINQKAIDMKQGIVRPIPVPRDWKPSLELPQHMLENQPSLQLEIQIIKLQRLIVNHNNNNDNSHGYIVRAHGYLSTANTYLEWADSEKTKARAQEFRAKSEQMKAEFKETDELFKARASNN
ncbi:hypothetical protein ABFS82_12G016800 [Erythranthe guttata]